MEPVGSGIRGFLTVRTRNVERCPARASTGSDGFLQPGLCSWAVPRGHSQQTLVLCPPRRVQGVICLSLKGPVKERKKKVHETITTVCSNRFKIIKYHFDILAGLCKW